MSRVEELERAIENLSSEEFIRLSQWFQEKEQARWDEQMNRDAASGKLDFLFEEAEREAQAGRLKPWPDES